jgi:hypothetical protein
MTTTPFLAHNLTVRRTAVENAQLVTSVGWVGNAAHQAECSDHNPDSTGDVHAIDCMTLVLANQKAIVQWALAHPDDLEYVINQRTIWSRSRGFAAHAYTGTDPHTNHVHISGRHGTSGNVPNVTCTGYDRTAEKITPEGIDMALTQADADLVAKTLLAAQVANSPTTTAAVRTFLTNINNQVNKIQAVANAVNADLTVDRADAADDVTVDELVAAVKTALPDTTAGGLTLDQVEQAVRAALAGATISPASPAV